MIYKLKRRTPLPTMLMICLHINQSRTSTTFYCLIGYQGHNNKKEFVCIKSEVLRV